LSPALFVIGVAGFAAHNIPGNRRKKAATYLCVQGFLIDISSFSSSQLPLKLIRLWAFLQMTSVSHERISVFLVTLTP
jgi:hypothetical protein